MLEENEISSIIYSEKMPNIPSYIENNVNNNLNNTMPNTKVKPLNTINTNTNINKINESSQRVTCNKNNKKRVGTPITIIKVKDKKDLTPTEKIKVEAIQTKKENINKIIEKYKFFIRQLQYFLKIKEDEINNLKKEIQKRKNVSKINKNRFDNLDTGGMGIIILSGKKQNNEESKIRKRIYKIQILDKMEISNIYKDLNINIETRDSIEILPTIKKPLKAQKVNEMFISPLQSINYIQIVDNLTIFNNNKIKKIKIEERDSIEILPTIKKPLKAQNVNQMFIKCLEVPEFLIQNLDNMAIIKQIKIGNLIESRDSININSEEKIPLQAQHTENMIIDSFEISKNENINIIPVLEKKDLLKTPRNKNFQKIRNSIEHIPLKKSPLQLKTIEDLRNKYLKKYKSEDKELKDYIKNEKDDLKIDNNGPVNVYNVNNKPKSNHKYYKYEHVSIKPTLKIKNTKQIIKNQNNLNNHRLKEVSYKNQKIYKYNLVTPKPSILPLSRTTKNIILGNNENPKDKYINTCNEVNKGSYYYKNIRNNNLNDNKTINTNEKNECEYIKGRNIRVIRTQKNGPSIIEKRYIAHSCEKCNDYLNFKKDNFHEIHSIKKKW